MNIKFNEISLSKIKEKCELDRRDAIDELNDEKRKTIFFSMLFFGLSLLFTIAFGVILFCGLSDTPAMIEYIIVFLLVISIILCICHGVTYIQDYYFEKYYLVERCKPDYFLNKRMPNLLSLKKCNQILEASFDEDRHLIITIDDNGEVKQIEFSFKGKKTRTDIDTVVINFEVENYQGFSVCIPYGQKLDLTNIEISNPNDIKKAIIE